MKTRTSTPSNRVPQQPDAAPGPATRASDQHDPSAPAGGSSDHAAGSKPARDGWRRNWHRVSAADPCTICGEPDWCLHSNDGKFDACKRIAEGAEREISLGNLHRRPARAAAPASATELPAGPVSDPAGRS